MRRKQVLFIVFLFFLNLSVFGQSTAQNMKLKFVTPLDFQRWMVLDDFNFDKQNNWDLTSAKQIENEPPQNSDQGTKFYFKKAEPGLIFSSLKGGRFLTDEYKENKSCLGAKVLFPENIQSTVLLMPKQSYKIDGLCKKISLWVLGRGRNVDFDIMVKDFMNRKYPLRVATLDFLGWRYFEVDVPPYIPQNNDAFPQKEQIEIEGFLVTSHPSRFADEVYKPFFVYVDQLEVFLDQYVTSYPGLEIQDNW